MGALRGEPRVLRLANVLSLSTPLPPARPSLRWVRVQIADEYR